MVATVSSGKKEQRKFFHGYDLPISLRLSIRIKISTTGTQSVCYPIGIDRIQIPSVILNIGVVTTTCTHTSFSMSG